ncbi:hypothetical protein PF011_g23829 [Phytophthora fragariae]|nr:hypothetical protein PF011_g23829 [Phytophthora fragariae]KAE9272910.1 hypothetical protein PF008_g29978 [Phytophthora fragariae]
MNEAASNGHLEVVKWFQATRSVSCSTKAMDGAAGNGHLDMVKWLHENTTAGCTVRAMDVAARNGHLDMVKWLHENTTAGCTTNAMDTAAAKDHLEMCKWLHANRSEGCTVQAVEYSIGHLRLGSWLRSHYPEIQSSDNRLWLYPRNLFDALLFLEANYPKVFTPEFARGTRSDLSYEYSNGSDALVEAWLNEKYPGQPTQEKKFRLWTAL